MSIYHSLFQSHITYGLCVWGKADLTKLFLAQKRAIRAIAGLDFGESTNESFKELNLLKLKDLYKFQFANLMWDQDHELLPISLNNIFIKISDVHNYETRSSVSQKLSENVKINTKTHGEKLFKFQGPKILNDLKNKDFYASSKTKTVFRAELKKYLISFY